MQRSPVAWRPVAEEMAHFGVHVPALAPGFFRTDFLDPNSATYTEDTVADYEEPLVAFLEFHHDRNRNTGDPAKLGEVLVHLATLDNPPTSIVAGSDAVEWATNFAREHLETMAKWRDPSTATDGTWATGAT